MPSWRSWSIAVSQLRTVDPSLSQEMWLAVMLSWTAEEFMMSRKQFSRHSSPTGARTRGGASTMNTITPRIFGLSSLIRSPPLQLHMQKHHPTPNQNFQGPPSTYNPHHHTLPFLSKPPTPTSPSDHLQPWKMILQRHGHLLRLHGAIWMYNRRFDVATRFHLPQKTWSQRHSNLSSEWDTLLHFLRYSCSMGSAIWILFTWTQYNMSYNLFEQEIWNMEQTYVVTLDLLSTLRHWSTTPPIQSYFIQWALLWSPHSPHLGNGSAAGATHIEPLAPPYAIGTTTTWQHPRKHWGLGRSIWTSWHYTSPTSSIFFQHGAHGYTHSTTRDNSYIHSLSPSISHCTTPTLPTFSTWAAPTCHKTHSQPTATPSLNKTPPHQPQSRHSSTTSHTQSSRLRSCTTSIKSTKSQESLTQLRRLHQPSLSRSGAVQTIAALLGPTGNPQSSHRADSYPGTRTITTGEPYWHHPSSMVFSRRRNPYQPKKWFQSTPELGFSRRKNAPNAFRMQGKMAIAPLATDSTLGDYAAAAASYIYESWTAATSYTSFIDSWGHEMHRHSLQSLYRNQLFTPSF